MRPYLSAHRKNLGLSVASALGGMGLAAFQPVIQKQIIDRAILAPDGARDALAPWLILLCATGVARFLFGYGRRYFGGRVSLDVQYDLRNTIFDHLQRLDFARHDELETGQLVSRASSDVGMVQALLSMLPITLGNLLLFAVSAVIMVLLSVPLTLVALIVIPAILATAGRMRAVVFPSAWDAQQRAAEVAGVVDESVNGVRVVKAFGQEAREVERLDDRARVLYQSKVRAVRIQAKFAPLLQSIPVFGQVAILAYGGWLTIDGRMTIGTFAAFSSYLIQFVQPVRMLAMTVALAQQARASVERILELLDSNPVVTEQEGAVDLHALDGEIAFDTVTFGYLRSAPVLRDFSLTIQPGETVALVGASGSGKSTAALIVPRFYDVSAGAVRIDGIDVRDVTLGSLRRQVGVVFEESFLFSDSIRSNLAYGHPDATDDEIVAAARAAEADEFITALPEGYDTVVGERGLTLSGGQRQRIALARALLTDPRILILDDATSSVDARVEEEIHATLRRLMRGRTTILIAHRRSTLRLADRIAVLEGGVLLDVGTHEELLGRCSLYRQLLAGPGDSVEEPEPLVERAGEEATGALGVTATAWPRGDGGDGARATWTSTEASRWPVFGGGSFGSGLAGGMAATPELLARVAALPPADDDPDVDGQAVVADQGPFSVRRFVRPFRAALAIGLLFVLVDALCGLSGPLLVRYGIDHGVRRFEERILWIIVGVFAGVVALQWAAQWAEQRQTGRTSERVLYALRLRIFAHLQRLSLSYYDREMAGKIMTRMTTDVESLSNLLQQGLISAVVNAVTFVGVLAALFVMNWKLALATMLILPPLVASTLWFKRFSDVAYEDARERIAVVNANLQENLSGVRVTQAFTRESRNMQQFRAIAGEHLDARIRAQKLQSWYFPFVEMLSVLALAIVLGVAHGLVIDGALSAGALVAFLLYLNQLFAPIQQLSQVFDMYQQADAAVDKIRELVDTPTGTPEAAAPVHPGRLEGHIAFERVTFQYATAPEPALVDVSFEIPPGQSVALVGETGAGKSTIVKLVARFYETSAGRVLIDGTDVDDFRLAEYRRNLGYVPQEAFLFAGTIRDNIAYGRPTASDAEVEAAARAVGAHDFIAALPQGYLQPVSERGRSLSSGQRQLIALARAQLVDPPILLLDEATSNLDLGTEARVNRAMGIVAQGRTTILIAHRLETARRADRILVVDHGRIVEDGSHDALLAARGRYAELWESFAAEGPARTTAA
jgi:ATP-binding cassette subfamily B protein